MARKQKLIIVGLDGMSPRLIEQWASDGHLPTFARLMTEGAFGLLQSTGEFSSPQAWPSFMTGVNPGKHGVLSFMVRIPGSYDVRRADASDIDAPTFFSVLSNAGCRVAALNVPFTYPAEALNGIRELAEELRAKFGSYPFHVQVKTHARRGRHDRGFEQVVSGMRRKWDIAQYLMDRDDWDVFTLVFVETDAAHHYFWHMTDPRHPRYQSRERERYGDLLLRTYQATDDVLANLLQRLDDETTLLILSDHGSAIDNRGRLYVRSFLEHMGLLVSRSSPMHRLLVAPGARRTRAAFEQLHSILPTSVKVRLYHSRRVGRLVERFFSRSLSVSNDWSRTKAYCYYWETSPWINTKGRDPQGIVEAGEDYEGVRDYLMQKLREARDPATGEPATKAVFTREELYQGPHLDRSPDIVVWWNEDTVLQGLTCKRDGETQERVASAAMMDDMGNTGAHHPQGVFLAWGNGVRPGARPVGAHIVDVAPTALALMGYQPLRHMDGRVLDEAFQDGHLSGSTREAVVAGPSRERRRHAYSETEETAVQSRLKDLGYL